MLTATKPTWRDYADAIEEVIEAYEAETERWASRRKTAGMIAVIEQRRKVAVLAREGLKPAIAPYNQRSVYNPKVHVSE